MREHVSESCFGGPGKGEKRLYKRFLKRTCEVARQMTAPGASRWEEQPVVWSTLRCTWSYDTIDMAIVEGIDSMQSQEIAECDHKEQCMRDRVSDGEKG